MSDNWRGKKRWTAHNKVEALRGFMAIEAILDSCHQKNEPPSERQISQMLGICRSFIETQRRKGNQQATLKAWIHPTGTKRPKNDRL